jgi:hypothetical protein
MVEITKEVIEEIRDLENKKGQITPVAVLDAARDESSSLHAFFQWDDSVAAEKYRIDQARTLIVRVQIMITVEHTTIKAPTYVRDPTQDSSLSGYVTTIRVKEQNKMGVVRDEVSRIAGNIERSIAVVKAMNGNIPPVVVSNLESALSLMQDILKLTEVKE